MNLLTKKVAVILKAITLCLSFSLNSIAATSAPLYGVTIDNIEQLSTTVGALASLSQKMTARIVFDEYQPPSDYLDAVNAISNVSFVMGEILDSFYVKQYSVQAYLDRTLAYLNALENRVDIWEIGNEINGEWLGNIDDVILKMTGAYNIVNARGGQTALTLYYNEDCWKYPSEEMFGWAATNIPADMKNGLDYVLISYYEEDCNDLRPDWPAVFARLANMFPNSKIGFGESGTTNEAEKEDYIKRYYKLDIDQPNYIGGYFWWYFVQDMVPKVKPLWQVLDDAITVSNSKPGNQLISPTINFLLHEN